MILRNKTGLGLVDRRSRRSVIAVRSWTDNDGAIFHTAGWGFDNYKSQWHSGKNKWVVYYEGFFGDQDVFSVSPSAMELAARASRPGTKTTLAGF